MIWRFLTGVMTLTLLSSSGGFAKALNSWDGAFPLVTSSIQSRVLTLHKALKTASPKPELITWFETLFAELKKTPRTLKPEEHAIITRVEEALIPLGWPPSFKQDFQEDLQNELHKAYALLALSRILDQEAKKARIPSEPPSDRVDYVMQAVLINNAWVQHEVLEGEKVFDGRSYSEVYGWLEDTVGSNGANFKVDWKFTSPELSDLVDSFRSDPWDPIALTITALPRSAGSRHRELILKTLEKAGLTSFTLDSALQLEIKRVVAKLEVPTSLLTLLSDGTMNAEQRFQSIAREIDSLTKSVSSAAHWPSFGPSSGPSGEVDRQTWARVITESASKSVWNMPQDVTLTLLRHLFWESVTETLNQNKHRTLVQLRREKLGKVIAEIDPNWTPDQIEAVITSLETQAAGVDWSICRDDAWIDFREWISKQLKAPYSKRVRQEAWQMVFETKKRGLSLDALSGMKLEERKRLYDSMNHRLKYWVSRGMLSDGYSKAFAEQARARQKELNDFFSGRPEVDPAEVIALREQGVESFAPQSSEIHWEQVDLDWNELAHFDPEDKSELSQVLRAVNNPQIQSSILPFFKIMDPSGATPVAFGLLVDFENARARSYDGLKDPAISSKIAKIFRSKLFTLAIRDRVLELLTKSRISIDGEFDPTAWTNALFPEVFYKDENGQPLSLGFENPGVPLRTSLGHREVQDRVFQISLTEFEKVFNISSLLTQN